MTDLTESVWNYSNICRICLRSGIIQDLFNADHNGRKLAELLAFCLKKLIYQGDGLPGSICDVCRSKLITVYEFHMLYSHSEKRCREIYLESQNTYPALKEEIKLCTASDCDSEIKAKTKKNLVRPENSKKKETIKYIPQSRKQTVENPDFKIKTFECFECKQSLRKFTDLQRHLVGHNNNSKLYQCSECQMQFLYLKSLFRHRRKHTTRIHECEYCTDAFATMTDLKQHLKALHKNELKTHKCDLCGRNFILRSQLDYHQFEHSRSQQIPCKICGETFLQHRHLRSHIRTTHTTHLCSECGKTFKTIHLLASHQNLHKSDTPFACNYCPNRFKWKVALTTHMLIHTGQKKHVCDICNATFTTKGSLNKHHLIHTGNRPFPCETCSMRFYSKDHLKRHIRTHSGEKPYQCVHCHRSFSQSNDLTKHIRSHVGQNTYKCPECPKAFRLQTEMRNHSYEHYKAAIAAVKIK